jgi:hypothetical protein
VRVFLCGGCGIVPAGALAKALRFVMRQAISFFSGPIVIFLAHR